MTQGRAAVRQSTYGVARVMRKMDCHRGSNAIGDWGVDVEGRGEQTKQEASASSIAVLGTNL